MNKDMRGEIPPLSAIEYDEFSLFLKTVCGINLGSNKQYLVATRVRRILIEHDIPNLNQLTQRIKKDGERVLRQQVIDAMTTNETFWFRDAYPFDYLAKTVIPSISALQPGKAIKVWSAACSTGQEPYSISMVFEELLKNKFSLRVNDGEILATDVSTTVLESARKAVYDRLSLVRGLSNERASAFFRQIDDESWQLNDNICNRVRFRPLNLQESYYLLGKFDIVFCRNVLIYFSNDLKQEILRKIHGTLNPGGILFLGSSESISGLNSHFDMIHCNPGVAYRAKEVGAV